MRKKIAVIIVNFNGGQNIVDCLLSLNSLFVKNYFVQTIVIDNNSQDKSIGLVKKKFPKVIIIANNTNLGFSEGNNIGIRWAMERNFDYFLLLNNDTLAQKELLKYLINSLESNHNIGIISPKIYFAKGYEFHKKRYQNHDLGKVIWYAGGKIDWQNMLCKHRGVDEIDAGQYQNKGQTDFATGCCMLIKKQVVLKIGLFDQKYFLYWEDVDFCLRAKRADFKIYYEPKAILWHKNAGSSAVGSVLHDYYLTRNRLIFGFKYAPLRTKIAISKELIKQLFQSRPAQKKAIRDFILGKFGYQDVKLI